MSLEIATRDRATSGARVQGPRNQPQSGHVMSWKVCVVICCLCVWVWCVWIRDRGSRGGDAAVTGTMSGPGMENHQPHGQGRGGARTGAGAGTPGPTRVVQQVVREQGPREKRWLCSKWCWAQGTRCSPEVAMWLAALQSTAGCGHRPADRQSGTAWPQLVSRRSLTMAATAERGSRRRPWPRRRPSSTVRRGVNTCVRSHRERERVRFFYSVE